MLIEDFAELAAELDSLVSPSRAVVVRLPVEVVELVRLPGVVVAVAALAATGSARATCARAFAVGFFLHGEAGFGRLKRCLGLFQGDFSALRVERRDQLPLGDVLAL